MTGKCGSHPWPGLCSSRTCTDFPSVMGLLPGALRTSELSLVCMETSVDLQSSPPFLLDLASLPLLVPREGTVGL